MSSKLESFNIGYSLSEYGVELCRCFDDGSQDYEISCSTDLYDREDADEALEELRRKHTWKDCTKELPGESGVYLVKCVSKVDGKAYLVTCCLFEEGEWKSGGIPGENIAYWCDMPENAKE